MPTLLKTAGALSVIAAGTGGGVEVGDAIAAPVTKVESFGQLVRDFLDQYTGDADIYIDPIGRKVYAATDATKRAAMSVLLDDWADDSVIIEPDAGQTGRSLTYTPDGGLATFSHTSIKNNITAATATAKPKRSVESLVSAILASADLDEGKFFVKVSQTSQNICVYGGDDTNVDTVLTGLAAVTPGATDMVAVGVALPVTATEGGSQVFEGGLTT